MDSSFVIKPPPAARPVRDTLPVREAVATDLGSEQAVTSRHGGKGSHDNPREHDTRKDRDTRSDHTPPDLVADAASLDVILREREVRSADLKKPDQALLRYRAYNRHAYAEPDTAGASDPHADIKA